MAIPERIQAALAVYDQAKGPFRKLFYVNHPAIRSLRRLSEADQNDFLKLYGCFVGSPNPNKASYGVFKAILEEFDVDEDVVYELSRVGCLTLENLKAARELTSVHGLIFALRAINKTKLKKTSHIKTIFARLLHKDNSFLCSEAAIESIWSRLPPASVTKTVFNQLVEYAWSENPEQKIKPYVDTLLHINAPAAALVTNSRHNPPAAMAFPEVIQAALKVYDQKKGFFRKLFSIDHPAIRALRKLPESDRNNIYKICKCFVDNPISTSNEVYQAVNNVLFRQYKMLTLHDLELLDKNFFTQINFDIAVASKNPIECFSAMNKLHKCHLLTEENRMALAVSSKPSSLELALRWLYNLNILTKKSRKACVKAQSCFIEVLDILRDAKLLTRENIEQLLDSNYLYTALAKIVMWSRLPVHLLTQTQFNEFMRLASGPNPTQQIQQRVDELLGIRQTAPIPIINNNQSTHTASVHKSISESAIRLFQSYKNKIDTNAKLENVLKEIQQFIQNFPDINNLKKSAAKRCIARICAFNNTFTDPVSELSIKQLLALSFLAICDEEKRIGHLDDAQFQFIEGLYEVQRGYNLSANDVDNGAGDRPICIAGTFNKLIEKLQGVHPACEVHFITPQIASYKLLSVAREEAINYLSRLANPQTAEEYVSYKTLIDQIKKDGIEVIWNEIKDRTADRMFEEFGSLYREGKSSNAFSGFLDTAKDITFEENFNYFHQEVQNSPSYNQFCSSNQIANANAGFFQPAASGSVRTEPDGGAAMVFKPF